MHVNSLRCFDFSGRTKSASGRSLKRFLHISILKNTRTPLHDHARKNKGWSDEQVVARWLIMQCVASALLLLIVRG